MAESDHAAVRRRGAPLAAATAIGIGVILLVQRLLGSLIAAGAAAATTIGVDLLDAFASVPAYSSVVILPVVLGVFLSLWLLAPIAAELRLFHVVMRSVLAIGTGFALAFIVSAVLGVARAFSFGGPMFGASFPMPTVYLDGIPSSLLFALTSALSGFITVVPLGVLAGVLAWYWLTRHPVQHPVSGSLDGV